LFVARDPHTPATTAGGCFDHDGEADAPGNLQVTLAVLVERSVGTGHRGDACLAHDLDGRYFIAHAADGLGAGADKGETALLDLFSELSIFSEEAIAGMNGIGIRDFHGRNERWHMEVTIGGGGRPDAD